MKAKLRRDSETLNPEWDAKAAGEARKAGKPYNVPHSLPVPKGTVIDHPDAFRLVQLGHADPEDEECRIRAGMTPAEIQAQEKIALKIENAHAKEVKKAQEKAAKSG